MTTRAFVLGACLASCLLTSACTHTTSSQRATSIPPALCSDRSASERTASILGTPGLLSIAPDIQHRTMPKGWDDRRLQGVVLRYAAPAGVTDAWFERQLVCHQVDVTEDASANANGDDPFVATSGRLSYAVELTGPELVVRVRAADEATAAEVVDRARRLQNHAPEGPFTRDRGVYTSP